MPKKIKLWLFFGACFVFIGCDRLTKDMAKEHLKDKASISLFSDSFRLQYVENTGAALNLGEQLSDTAAFWILGILPLVFLLILMIYAVKKAAEMDKMRLLCFALLFSGGMGNIIDRLLFDRHVTDFMNIGIGSIRTGIFNVADVCVTAAVIGFLLTQKNQPRSMQKNGIDQ